MPEGDWDSWNFCLTVSKKDWSQNWITNHTVADNLIISVHQIRCDTEIRLIVFFCSCSIFRVINSFFFAGKSTVAGKKVRSQSSAQHGIKEWIDFFVTLFLPSIVLDDRTNNFPQSTTLENDNQITKQFDLSCFNWY